MSNQEEFSDYAARYVKISMDDFDDYFSAPSLDKPPARPQHDSMNSPTREEIDAKLETIEVKIEGRMSRIEDKLVAISNTITAQKNAVWQASAVVVGTIVATAALVLTSFDSGRETTKVAADAKEQITKVNEETAKTLAEIKRIAAELQSSQSAKPGTPQPSKP